MLWSHNNKNQYFCNIIKSRCRSDRGGAGRVNANTHYRPAPVIEAKVLLRSHPATSTGRVKSVQVETGRCKISIPIHYKEVWSMLRKRKKEYKKKKKRTTMFMIWPNKQTHFVYYYRHWWGVQTDILEFSCFLWNSLGFQLDWVLIDLIFWEPFWEVGKKYTTHLWNFLFVCFKRIQLLSETFGAFL